MRKPIDAPLLADHHDDPDPDLRRMAESDERFPGVHLIGVDDDGEGKTTAQALEHGWGIAEWELTDGLTPPLDGSRYWFRRHWYTIDNAMLCALVELGAVRTVAPPHGDHCGYDPQALRDALDHIARTCRQARTKSRRVRWIEARAQGVLEGKRYNRGDFSMPPAVAGEYERLRRQVDELKGRNKALALVAEASLVVPVESLGRNAPELQGAIDHGNKALAHLSDALEDLTSSPDQRPVPLVNEAIAHVRAMLGLPEIKPAIQGVEAETCPLCRVELPLPWEDDHDCPELRAAP